MEKVNIRFYDIHKCGYFLRGEKEPKISDMKDCLLKIIGWAKDGRKIENTKTYGFDDENNSLNTYFVDSICAKDSDDILLILWNEIQNKSGTVYGLSTNQSPGHIKMTQMSVGDEFTIPGAPSYFWFLPNDNLFASIKFDHSMFGKGNLDKFINGFLLNKSEYRVKKDKETVVGFSSDGNSSDNMGKIHPCFYATVKKSNKIQKELMTNIHMITKIIKTEELEYTIVDQRNFIEKFFTGLLVNNPSQVKSRLIKHELTYKPTEDELKEIISNFNKKDRSANLINVGFNYSNGRKVMLKNLNLSFSYDLAVSKEKGKVVSTNDLLATIIKAKPNLLRSLE